MERKEKGRHLQKPRAMNKKGKDRHYVQRKKRKKMTSHKNPKGKNKDLELII